MAFTIRSTLARSSGEAKRSALPSSETAIVTMLRSDLNAGCAWIKLVPLLETAAMTTWGGQLSGRRAHGRKRQGTRTLHP